MTSCMKCICFCPQAILFMSLASGKSSLRVSPLNKRSRTVIKAIEAFTEVPECIITMSAIFSLNVLPS